MASASLSSSFVGHKILLGCTKVHHFEATLDVHKNYIQVPLNYHINWYPKYPTYVVLKVNGDNSYFVRVRRYENKIYFADGIKEFRSAMKLYENMVIRFSAADKNTTFHVSFSTPAYRQLSATSPATTQRHVFTVDVDEDMLQQKKPLVLPPEALKYVKYKRYMKVERSSRRCCLWKINVENDVRTLADPWFQYLADNDFMSGDEVLFYYTFKKHGWDVLYRKQLIWDDDQSD
ncbi:hypothetical protein JHK84_028129 [Glycine max]|nr:hypothetical protein JHK85_028546 [Glycine max]KAG5003870.1 hypothetical protein JHK86_028009 [Glycine max]KAG5151657.1 hypothetical protein JHK84_028129 [Glycine max]